ncbi:hypothetical protein QYE76_035344 [Lolium multiflorum]|uniref:Uncharacterized protein n=1 Tax=Lolium multiflorum TaxID=4521 RepID=A0AAD8QZI2_LOLMU|nr:hypothetical protein QYE76_035344 [Lolium multiflorum]
MNPSRRVPEAISESPEMGFAAAASPEGFPIELIGSEHLFPGLLPEGEGVAALVLEYLGADPSNNHTQVIMKPIFLIVHADVVDCQLWIANNKWLSIYEKLHLDASDDQQADPPLILCSNNSHVQGRSSSLQSVSQQHRRLDKGVPSVEE